MFGKKIEKTAIISDDSKKSLGSGIIRGGVGTVLLGPVGLVAGAMSAKNKKTTTFLICYSDGTKETKTVKTNSSEFKNYAKYLDI